MMVDAATAAGRRPGRYSARDGPAGSCSGGSSRPRSRPRPPPPARRVDAMPLVTPPLRPFLRGGAGALESEHRQATIAFVLAGGFDERLADAADGPRRVAADLDAWFGAACEAASATASRSWTPTPPPTAPCCSSPPAPRSRPARRTSACSARCATSSRSPRPARLRLRAGTNRGPVFAGDFGAPIRRTYTAMGDTTNLAARIAHRAAPGQLLATADVLTRSETEFAVRALPAFTAKGKTEPVVPVRVGRPGGARSPGRPPAPAHRARRGARACSDALA